MIELIKKILKSCRIGQLLYTPLNRVYRLYSLPTRRRHMKKYGYAVLDKVYEISEVENFGVFAVFGSLLGYVREGGFIPHDTDLDFGVLPGVTPAAFTKIMVEKYGFKYLHGFSYHGEITEVTLQYQGVPMDFIFYKTDDQKCWCTVPNWSKDAHYTDPRQNSAKHVNQAPVKELKQIQVHGARVRIPVNAEEMLVSVFGESWRIPDPSFKPTQQPGNVYLTDFAYLEPYDAVIKSTLPPEVNFR